MAIAMSMTGAIKSEDSFFGRYLKIEVTTFLKPLRN
jgi:hypothetical protein